MTTDYKNLTAFEIGAVSLAVVGVVMIMVQIFISLPTETKTQISGAFQVLDMKDTWATQVAVNDFVISGVREFYSEFYVASAEVFSPVRQDATVLAHNVKVSVNAMSNVGRNLAFAKQEYFQSGVEAGFSGKVMGAFIDKLSEIK